MSTNFAQYSYRTTPIWQSILDRAQITTPTLRCYDLLQPPMTKRIKVLTNVQIGVVSTPTTLHPTSLIQSQALTAYLQHLTLLKSICLLTLSKRMLLLLLFAPPGPCLLDAQFGTLSPAACKIWASLDAESCCISTCDISYKASNAKSV